MDSGGTLSTHALFAWGVLGGLMLFLFGVLLPELFAGGDETLPTRQRVKQNLKDLDSGDLPSVIVAGGFYALGGGVAAWLIGADSSTHRQAFTYGLGWPTLIKALSEGVFVATKIGTGK
jgi:hypothetical protein